MPGGTGPSLIRLQSHSPRIREATERGWLGEIEELQVSPDAARQKMEQIRRIRLRGTLLELGPTRRTTPAPK